MSEENKVFDPPISITALEEAKSGDPHELSRYVRAGLPLDQDHLDFLADFLDTATPKRGRGRSKPFIKEMRDKRIWQLIGVYRRYGGLTKVEAATEIAESFYLSTDRVLDIYKEQQAKLKPYINQKRGNGGVK